MRPVAYLHIMHQEFGQKQKELTFTKANPFGKAGADYSREYKVTTEPLYLARSNRGRAMNDLTDAIYPYVDRDGMIEPAEMWSEEDLRKLVKAARAELKRRTVPTSEDQ